MSKDINPNCPAHRVIETRIVGWEKKNGQRLPIRELVDCRLRITQPTCTCGVKL